MAAQSPEDPELERLREQKLKRYVRLQHLKATGLDWPEAPVEQATEAAVSFVKKYPVALLEFWAQWCKPCLKMKPLMEELATEYWGDVAFARLDLDKNPDARDLWGVTVLPTLVITKHALEVTRIEGAATRTRLVNQLAPYAASPEERVKREWRTRPPGAHGE